MNKIVVTSFLYPSEIHPFAGKFVKDQVELLEELDSYSLKVLVPTPKSIPFTNRNKINTSPLINNQVSAERLKYISFPEKRFPKAIRSFLSKKLLKNIENFNPDLIHIHWLYPDGITIPILKKAGHKCVLTIHGSDWYGSIDDPKVKKLLIDSLEKVDLILCVGPDLVNDITSDVPQIKHKTELIYNYFDESLHKKTSAIQKEAAIQFLEWDNDAINILTVSTIRPQKGLDLLVKAIHELNTMYSNRKVYYHLIGYDPQDEYSRSFHKLKAELKVDNLKIYDPIDPKSLIRFYQASDFYIQPSRREGFGLAQIEAAASGMPIISTSVGIGPDFIDNDIGLLAKPNDTESLIENISQMIDKYKDFDSDIIRKKAIWGFGRIPFRKKLINYYQKVLESEG